MATQQRNCFIIIILGFFVSAEAGIPAMPRSTSCVFDLICRYNFLSSKAEEQRDTRQLSPNAPEDANALTQLALMRKPSGRAQV